jgi:hypothetical protein
MEIGLSQLQAHFLRRRSREIGSSRLRAMKHRFPLCLLLVIGSGVPLACGSRDVVKDPLVTQNTVSRTPSTVDPQVAPPSIPGTSNGGKTIVPRSGPLAPDELRRLIAAVAKDPPVEPGKDLLRRVTTVQGPGGNAYVVSLTDSLVDDQGLAEVARITGVRALYLDNCREITPQGLAHLAQLQELQKLSLSKTAVDNASLQYLGGLSELIELNLFGNAQLTDAGMAALAACKRLRSIKLQETSVGDEGLRRLKSLPNLQEIWLDGTRVTEQGLRELEAARNGIKIRHFLRRRMAP